MLLGTGPQGPIAGRRVAVTGMGVVSCCGVGRDALWTGLLAEPPEGERRVPDFDPERWFSAKDARQVDRFTQFSVAVAAMEVEDAGEIQADPGRSGSASRQRLGARSRTVANRGRAQGSRRDR